MRRSPVRKKSYGSVTVFWLDRDALLRSVEEYARKMADVSPEIERVVLFGSAAEGTATASSDIDLMIVVTRTAIDLLDRPGAYMRWFDDIGMPVDLFVYTEEELEHEPSSIAERASKHGLVVFDRAAKGEAPSSPSSPEHY